MNLKERGITVGDLLLFVIFIIATVFIVNNVKNNETESSINIFSNQKIIERLV